VDNSGAVQTQYSYEPFGTTTATGAANGNVFQFTGRENDGTGLYYFRARYYHPGLQRFISEDPIGFRGGDWNLYAYVRNNPVRYRDPMGLYILEYTHPDPECIQLGGRKDECGPGPGDPAPPMYACWICPSPSEIILVGDNRDLRGRQDQAWARSVGNGLERGAQRILDGAQAGARRGRTPELSGGPQRAENLWNALRNGRPFDPHRDTTGGGYGVKFQREDGTVVTLRFKPDDGSARINIGSQEYAFPR